MPEVTGSWPEEGAQYVPGAPVEPVQQAYPPQAPYPQQPPYQQQGYQEPQYHQAQQQYPQQGQQYPQQQYQEQTVPQQAVFYEEEQAAVPSEFDHLFRDSSPQERRSISARQPMVSGPGAAPSPGFQQQQQQPQAQPQNQVAMRQATQVQAAPTAQVAQQAPASTAMFHPSQQPQYAGGYAGGGGYEGPGGSGGSGSGSRRTPLVIGGAVVLIAAVGLYFGLSGGSGSSGKAASTGKTTTTSTGTASKETAQQQADAVYKLVKQARTLRGDISNEVGELKACDISAAAGAINATAAARTAAASEVAALPVGKISGGSAVTSALQAAWQASAASDQAYAKAAADFASGGCTASAVDADPNYRQASQDSTPSDNAKATAAGLWNSDMTKYEPGITADDL